MKDASISPRFQELQVRSQRLLVDFLRQELQLGFTFADFAASERILGNIAHSERARDHAATAASAIRKFLNRVENLETRSNINQRCTELEGAVGAL